MLGPTPQRRNRIMALVAAGRAVSAYINEIRRNDPRCGRLVMIRQAQRDIVVAQNLQDRILVPALMPELEGIAIRLGKHLDEIGQAILVRVEAPRQLQQHGTAFLAENLKPGHQERDRVLRTRLETLPMGDELGRLPGETKRRGRAVVPSLHRLNRWRAIEGAVDLGCVELLRIPGEPVLLRDVLRVERPAPVLISPAGRPNMKSAELPLYATPPDLPRLTRGTDDISTQEGGNRSQGSNHVYRTRFLCDGRSPQIVPQGPC